MTADKFFLPSNDADSLCLKRSLIAEFTKPEVCLLRQFHVLIPGL